jgi:hypothetical protein
MVLRATIKNLYGMLMQVGYLKVTSKTQILGDLDKFFKYHYQYGHDIDFNDEFHQ